MGMLPTKRARAATDYNTPSSVSPSKTRRNAPTSGNENEISTLLAASQFKAKSIQSILNSQEPVSTAVSPVADIMGGSSRMVAPMTLSTTSAAPFSSSAVSTSWTTIAELPPSDKHVFVVTVESRNEYIDTAFWVVGAYSTFEVALRKMATELEEYGYLQDEEEDGGSEGEDDKVEALMKYLVEDYSTSMRFELDDDESGDGSMIADIQRLKIG